ncbi:hypothetical protein U0070_012256 [Myodes glareolus]|uniref:Large ribosomal subunit protein eL21 n=1 Tax=Myodes glareolus TaxID=447135 RepID=A0AAW0JH55_MYOGA
MPMKHEVTPLATYIQIYKWGDIVDFRGIGIVQKGMPHKCYHGKTRRVYNVTQPAMGITVNKQVKGKIPAKRISVWIEHIKHSKRRDSFLRQVKENDQKEKEAKEKGTWVQLKCQPVLPREAYFMRTNGKESGLLEPIPAASWLIRASPLTAVSGDTDSRPHPEGIQAEVQHNSLFVFAASEPCEIQPPPGNQSSGNEAGIKQRSTISFSLKTSKDIFAANSSCEAVVWSKPGEQQRNESDDLLDLISFSHPPTHKNCSQARNCTFKLDTQSAHFWPPTQLLSRAKSQSFEFFQAPDCNTRGRFAGYLSRLVPYNRQVPEKINHTEISISYKADWPIRIPRSFHLNEPTWHSEELLRLGFVFKLYKNQN